MNTYKMRYPAMWKQYTKQSLDLDPSLKGLKRIDRSYNAYDDTKLNKLIIDNQYEIIKLCDDMHNEELKNVIDNLMDIEKLPWYISEDLPSHCSTTILINCIKNSDVELFRVLAQYHYMYVYIVDIDNMIFICEHNDPIPFLNILIENNIKISPASVSVAISRNNTKFISYLISVNYDIVQGWTKYMSDICRGSLNELSIPMLKILMNSTPNNKIDISLNLKDLMYIAIYEKKQNIIEFLIESFPNHDVNQHLGRCCEKGNDEALIYFLKKGANIHIIDTEDLYDATIKIIKILIDNNYVIKQQTLEYHLIQQFMWQSDLNNVNYLLKIGAQIKWIFDREDAGKNRVFAVDGMCCNKNIYSLLEFIIANGHFNKIKFLAEHYLPLLQPEINRLFVIACANGRNDIARYLFDFGVELNDKALLCAIFFGHHDTVIMLLKLGLNFNLTGEYYYFKLAEYGYVHLNDVNSSKKRNYSFIDGWYVDLVNNNTIFRNDFFICSNDYFKIVKLLVDFKVPHNEWPMDPCSEIFYDVGIFTYFMQNGIDINKKVESFFLFEETGRSFLEGAIIFMKVDVIEFLLQLQGINKMITNVKAIETINNNEQIKNLLLKYGVDVDVGIQIFHNNYLFLYSN